MEIRTRNVRLINQDGSEMGHPLYFIAKKSSNMSCINKILLILQKLTKNAKNMTAKRLKKMSVLEWVVVALACAALCLIIAGLCIPPMGVIDGSVLIGVGEMFAFDALIFSMYAFGNGADVTAKKGDIELTINNNDDDDE